MSNQPNERGDALFDQLNKNKKKKKRKTLRTVIIVVLVIAVALVGWFNHMRKQVEEQFAAMANNVLSFDVTRGTISTTVNGSGVLEAVDLYTVEVPAGVRITEVLVEADAPVTKGDVLATVDMASVMDTMADVQDQLNELDQQIKAASADAASKRVNAGVAGRVKILYAAKEMDVVGCMVEHGALAVLSLDGYMAVDIETDALCVGDRVTVLRMEGKALSGTVASVAKGTATILVTDNGPKYDEEVTVAAEDGTEVGNGKLYIHSPLAVTGYAGTVTGVHVKENAQVQSGTKLFSLGETDYNANYDSLLRQRKEKEEMLMELLSLYRDGAVLAAADGLISSVEYTDEPATAAPQGAEKKTKLLTVYPNIGMRVTVAVDEMDILALQVGQEAEVTVSSVSEERYAGTVTEIHTTANENTGMSQYSAVVVLDKQEGMLPGMTADVDVKIQGVEDAVIIPVDALHQTSSIYYVYTSYNEESMQYGDRVEVTIGMSGGNYVQITSGLDVGDTVYYTQTQSWFEIWAQGGFNGRMPGNFGR